MKLSVPEPHLNPDSAVDLHLHTTFSDGHWTLEELLDDLAREQFGLAAITDHDRTDTIAAIQELAQAKHLPVLVGVEMTATWKGELVDLLCYGFNPENSTLNDLTADLLHRQCENTREVYEKLERQGFSFSPNALTALQENPSCQQPHAFVALLQEHGYGVGEPSAGRILSDAGIAFATNTPSDIVEAVHQSGGLCILAHPGHGDGFVTFDVGLLDQFRRVFPIDGLEVYHPLHSPAQTETYLEYTRRNNLLASAGSDSHGPEKPPIKYRAELCRAFLERIGINLK